MCFTPLKATFTIDLENMSFSPSQVHMKGISSIRNEHMNSHVTTAKSFCIFNRSNISFPEKRDITIGTGRSVKSLIQTNPSWNLFLCFRRHSKSFYLTLLHHESYINYPQLSGEMIQNFIIYMLNYSDPNQFYNFPEVQMKITLEMMWCDVCQSISHFNKSTLQ